VGEKKLKMVKKRKELGFVGLCLLFEAIKLREQKCILSDRDDIITICNKLTTGKQAS